MTATIPILGITQDMVQQGLVDSLARPGGNTTGVSVLATELDGKRQEILIEAVPELRRMAILADSKTTRSPHLQVLQDAARARGVEVSIHQVASAEEITAAIDAAKASGAAALNVLSSPLLYGNQQLIRDRVAAVRLPAIYSLAEGAEEGGFVAYGPRLVQIFRDLMAQQLVKLLRGVKPADIPIEQPTTFELVINLKTANAQLLASPILTRRNLLQPRWWCGRSRSKLKLWKCGSPMTSSKPWRPPGQSMLKPVSCCHPHSCSTLPSKSPSLH